MYLSYANSNSVHSVVIIIVLYCGFDGLFSVVKIPFNHLWKECIFYYYYLHIINPWEWSYVVSFAIECETGEVPIYINRIFKGNAFEETFQIWEGEPKTGTLMYEKNGLYLANTQQNYEVCLNKALHTLVLLNAYETRLVINV